MRVPIPQISFQRSMIIWNKNFDHYFFAANSIMKLSVIPFTVAQDAAVVISFPHGGIADYWAFRSAYDGCVYTDKKLDGGATCAALLKYIEAHVMYPASMAGSIGVTNMNVSVSSSHVIIAANCKKTAAGIRKLCNLISRNLRPDRVYVYYAILIGQLFGTTEKGEKRKIRPDKDSYNHCAGKLIDGLDKLEICLFGKVEKLKDEAIDGIERGAEGKLPDLKATKGTLRTSYDIKLEPCCVFETIEMNDSFSAIIAQDYLQSIMPVFCHVSDGTISVEESVLKALKMADKESKFKAFASNFLKSKSDESNERLIYYAASRAHLTCADAMSASKKKLNAKDIETIIKKAL